MEGKKISFAWTNQNGDAVTSKDLAGSPYILYFYPKDDTPGCTTEACGIRDAWAEFAAAGIKIFGVSLDTEAKHQKFISKYELPFDLLVAAEKDLTSWGIYREKSMYGRTYMGIARETIIVGADGAVVKHYPKVKPTEHAAELLADFAAIT